MKEYGYIRVSSKDQNEERQLVAMREYGLADKHIFIDKHSGKDFDRPAYKQLMKKISPGATIVIKSIDRLGRNYEEILEQWRIITKDKLSAIVVLDMPLLDTRQKHDLSGALIADIMLQLYSYMAETEREFIRRRQAEGIAVAKMKGVKFGKRAIVIPANFDEVYKCWQDHIINSRQAADMLNVSQGTFLNWTKQVGKVK